MSFVLQSPFTRLTLDEFPFPKTGLADKLNGVSMQLRVGNRSLRFFQTLSLVAWRKILDTVRTSPSNSLSIYFVAPSGQVTAYLTLSLERELSFPQRIVA